MLVAGVMGATIAAIAVYSTAVYHGPAWILTSSMSSAANGVMMRSETFRRQKSEDQTRGWEIKQRQVSEAGNTKNVEEMLQRKPPLPLSFRTLFATFSLMAFLAIAVCCAVLLAVASSVLDCRALVAISFSVLCIFALLAAATTCASHVMLGPEWACWTSLVTTPLSFWSSVNFLGLLTRTVASGSRAYVQFGAMYAWLFPGPAVEEVASKMLSLEKLAPSLVDPFLGHPERPVTSAQWAVQLREIFSAHFNLAAYEALAAEVQAPELHRERQPSWSLWSKLLGRMRQISEAVSHLQAAFRESRITITDLVAFFSTYCLHLPALCLSHTRMKVGAAAASKKLSKEDAADSLQWRLVADQFTWCQSQKLSITDVAAKLLHDEPCVVGPLRIWLAIDVILSWSFIPGLWELPSRRRNALDERMQVLSHLANGQ